MIVGIVALAVGIAGELVALLLAYQRAPWCSCGHTRIFHQHDRYGSDCSNRTEDGRSCRCNRFTPPIIQRRITVWG